LRRNLHVILTTLFVASLARVPAARSAAATGHTPGFQLEADGALFTPQGAIDQQHNAGLATLYGNGGGAAFGATIGIRTHWVVGARISTFRSTKDGTFAFNDLVNPPGGQAAGTGPYDIERELRMIPIEFLAQYRMMRGPLEWNAEAGVGVMSTTGHLTLTSRQGSGELSSIAGYQKDPLWSIGTSLALATPGNTDLVGSFRFLKLHTGDGAVWIKGDDPGFNNWSIGLRYPHDTH
jgi:hypothetical protein